MDVNNFINSFTNLALNIGWKILGALVVLFVGRLIIKLVVRLCNRAMETKLVEPTLIRYIGSSISILLNLALFIAILGFFGFETTTFAALLAGVGVAIGAAWSGLLSNFAAGIFLVTLRPFRVGDVILAAGVNGIVKEVGMFVTVVTTPENVLTFIGNNKIFTETIQNFSTNTYRRIEIKVQLAPEADALAVLETLRENLEKIPNVLNEPPSFIGILELAPGGATLAVRPCAHQNHYNQVYFDTTEMIARTLEASKQESAKVEAVSE